MKNRKNEIIALAVLIIIQTALFVFFGFQKAYIHMDEAYSLGLAGYDKVEIQDNEDFYNTWHGGDYYEDYLALQEDELGEFSQVYENQKNDVHPPFYYLLLRIAMTFTVGHFSVWPGVVINIIVYAFITLFTYAIVQRILKGHKYQKQKSAVLAFLASVTMGSLTTAIYIRMYALTSLMILMIAYLHIRLKEEPEKKAKWFALIGVVALVGSLTHYYFLFYLFALFCHQAYRYLRSAEFKTLAFYVLTMAVAGGLSLAIFPYSIQHMFFGYRGEGFIDKLKNVPQFLTNVASYVWTVNEFGFNLFLLVIGIFSALVLSYRKNHRDRIKPVVMPDEETTDILKSLYTPTVFYFAIVAVASPWIELRYIAPVLVLIFVLVIYYFQRLLGSVFGETRGNVLVGAALVLMFIVFPISTNQEPQVEFSDKREIVQSLEGDLNLPTVYVFNSSHNRFLDDILLFSKLDESYVAKDVEMNVGNYKEILEGKDTSEGIIVFINYGYHNDDVIETFKQATGLENSKWLKRLNACDVYYIGNDINN